MEEPKVTLPATPRITTQQAASTNPIRVFAIRLVIGYIVFMGLWWLSSGIQLSIAKFLADLCFSSWLPHLQLSIDSGNHYLYFALGDATPSAFENDIDPLLKLTRGLPVYLALMLASPNLIKHSGAIIISATILFALSLMIFLGEAALQLAPYPPQWLYHLFAKDGITQIILKMLVARALPVGLWLWQQRHFVLAQVFHKD